MTSPYSTGVVGTFPISGNPQIDPFAWLGFKWGSSGAGTSAVVTYSFPTSTSTWSSDYALYLSNEPFNNFQPFTSTQQTAATQALTLWSEVANITFQKVTETPTNVGDIRFGNSGSVTNSPYVAWTYLPYDDDTYEYPASGDVWFDRAYQPNLQLLPGQFGFYAVLHEIGHAIGLDHPFYDGWGAGEPVLNPSLDNDKYTLMSYDFDYSTLVYASTPQLLDILAIQYIYGANMTTRTGNDTYRFSATTEVNRTIWDAGGNDTIDLSNQTTSSTINLSEGSYSRFCRHADTDTASLLGIAYGVTIENAKGGSAGDAINGNAVANLLAGGGGSDTITGFAGNDTLDGGTGNDKLKGGAGDDTYILDSLGDVVDEEGNTDTNDSVKSSVLIGAIAGIENYAYTGALAWSFTADESDNLLSGGSGSDNLNGAGGDDKLLGNGGNDILIGGSDNDWLDGGAGNDKLKGGAGNDTYEVSAAGDTIDELGADDPDDLVRASVSVDLSVLGAGLLEHAVLLGTTAINATGNDLDNELTGNIAANKLDGGIGADTMTGGKGADIYYVDDLGDVVQEDIGGTAGGIDLVNSKVSFALDTNLEKLTLTGSLDADGTGNALNNTIVGNSGANRLDGGSGNDTLTGGKGNDTYVVNSIGDVVNETILTSNGGGVDTVESSVTFSLATRANIEHLILTGSANTKGTGNALPNMITGNDGNNTLDGGAAGDTLLGGKGNDVLVGGAGADILKGGAGNDAYILDNPGDVVDEEGSTDSNDSVTSSALIGAAFAGIESYSYTGTLAWNFTGTSADNTISGSSASDTLSGAAGNDSLLGNGGNDLLAGNAGDDTLDGGAGNDKMKGGSGNDTYVINAVGDVIDEEGSSDTGDTVRSAITASMAALAGGAIEHAVLLGAGAINATGNGKDNVLTGNVGANKLDGGAGADTLIGGNGADLYVVDHVGDLVIETTGGAAGGIDLVQSSVDYKLGANVEKLTLTGTGNIDGTGNTLNNTLVGNIGANVLDGGAGNDTMTGGKGDDTYIVNAAGDVVTESILNVNGGGVDTVESSITFSLATRTNIEHLTLTGGANINGTGNALDNEIAGNTGANKLDGGAGNDILEGGLGNDTLLGGLGIDTLIGGDGFDNLNGGAGADTFDYNALSEAGDIISGFVKGVGGDKLDISDLLVGYTGIFGDFVGFTYSGTTTNVLVDVDGLVGGSSTTLLASLLNVNLTTADSGSFILPDPIV